MFSIHAHKSACWYTIPTCAEAGDRNLLSYLGLNEEDYNSLLIKLKLARKCGGRVETLEGNLEIFLANEYNGVPEYYEITPLFHFKTRMHFIKLCGKHDVTVYNPGKQQPANVKAWTYESLQRKYFDDGNGKTGERAKILFAINKLSELENADDDDSIDSDSIEGTVDNSNSKTGYDDEPMIEIDSSKYPFLDKLDITVKSSNLYALLREIHIKGAQ